MKSINSLEQPVSAGIFEDLSLFDFKIQEQNGEYEKGHKEDMPYIIYFKDKENDNYGIPIPDPSQNETYYKKYAETLVFDLFIDVLPHFMFNNNRFLNICCNYEEKEAVRKALILQKATEKNIVYSIAKVRIKKVDENTVRMIDEDSFTEDFTEHSRFKEFLFRMDTVGFEYFKDDLFKYVNAKIEDMESASKKFYSTK